MNQQVVDMAIPSGGYEIPNPSTYEIVGCFKVYEALKDGHEHVWKVSLHFPEEGHEYAASIAMNHPSVSNVLYKPEYPYLYRVFTFRKYPHTLETLDATSHLSFLDIQKFMRQLMRGLDHIHGLGYVHCALQPENIMVDETGGEPQLKIYNFAYAKPMNDPAKLSFAPLGYHLPLGYRPFEILMNRESPNGAMDVWCAGCVMARMIRRCKIFRGEDPITVVNNMIKALGVPVEEDQINWREMGIKLQNIPGRLQLSLPDTNSEAIDFISKLLTFEPSQRLTPLSALKHRYFSSDDTTERIELSLPSFP